MAIDARHKKLYVSSTGGGLHRCELDGTHCELFKLTEGPGLVSPPNVAVDPESDTVFVLSKDTLYMIGLSFGLPPT